MAFTPSTTAVSKNDKPALSFWNIWNISFGFLGVQIGYNLQTSNISSIFLANGADPNQINWFWIAAPLAGFIVQPIVGLSSDKTWTKLGRRIPFILGGAIVSALAMFFMPNSEKFANILSPLFFGAFMFLLMDMSFNVTMQPFRGLVSDMVPENQRNKGYSIQSFLINTGAVIGSLLPFILTWAGVANKPAPGAKVAPTVIWSFYFGGAALLLSVLWTSFRTKEYPPVQYAKYNNISEEKEKEKISFINVIKTAPSVMWQLAVTQFFSWFALIMMWTYTVQGIALNIWHTSNAQSEAFNDARNWNGVLGAAMSIFAALYSLILTPLANKFGRKNIYMISLIICGLGLISMMVFNNKYELFISMLGIGIGWASILAMPYAILSKSLPAKQTGVYMGIFNFTITLPQIVASMVGGIILKNVFKEIPIYMVALAGLSMILAGIFAKIVIRSKE
jgi:maltose/moltooligosaccharide transporter